MNNIVKSPISSIGYDFIPFEYLPDGKDEYHLRNRLNKSGIQFRSLKASELEILVRNNNSSDNWNSVLVSAQFDPHLVKGCSFFGLIRIGKLEALSLEFHGLRLPVGLFNSTIINCDFGDNVSIHNVNYFSHFVVGNEVIIANVNELATTSTAKFGNGIIKEGETENQRIWMEVCNENGGRKILPFDGMLTADAYLWSKYRDDKVLMKAFYAFTEQKFDAARGHYGSIGDRTVIKNCKMIKDVQIGTDAYIKGANKIKNVTVNSSADASTQIGEGCELVNGIIGAGCRIFYGVKAVRFFMASHSQLKYGARLINSYLGNNATISCCEVLNSLIYPFHEQHHNNSFLCASLLMGQSNVAAGATIGSNHNSRGADGELVAGRGFWPGLCVSLKHNSRFASFSLLAKGDFPFELNIPIPFSLIVNDPTANELRIIPAYWFQYNHYALQRNEWKYKDRDARETKELALEYRSLAPDSVNEIFTALDLLSLFAGKAYFRYVEAEIPTDELCKAKGRDLFNNDDKLLDNIEILAEGFENSKRKAVILKARKAYASFREMLRYYAVGQIATGYNADDAFKSPLNVKSMSKVQSREEWVNIGGQLVPSSSLAVLLDEIKSNKLNSWDAVHLAYKGLADSSTENLFQHALASLLEIENISLEELTAKKLSALFREYLATNEKVFQGIVQSREKDMTNPFRKMVYANEAEMDAVLGKMNDNSFIREKDRERQELSMRIENILAKMA